MALTLSLILPFGISLILAQNFSSVWDINTSGSIFPGEREFISFFRFYPFVAVFLSLLVFLFRNKWIKVYRIILVSLLLQLMFSLFLMIFMGSF
jgi:hypothetical protein